MKAKKAEKLFEDFHGRESREDIEINLRSFKNLTYLGKAVAVEYEARKHQDRKAHIYRHDVEDQGAMVLTNGKEILIFGNLKITEKGIEG